MRIAVAEPQVTAAEPLALPPHGMGIVFLTHIDCWWESERRRAGSKRLGERQRWRGGAGSLGGWS